MPQMSPDRLPLVRRQVAATHRLHARSGIPRALGLVAVAVHLALGTLAAPAGAETRWRRGINMGDYLAYPQSETWPIFRGPRVSTTDAEMRRLRAAGFDFVRLAVEPRPFIERVAVEVAASEERLLAFIRRAHAAGLKVIMTGWARHESPAFRPEDVIRTGRDETYRQYVSFLIRLAEVTRPLRDGKLALELMNEPQGPCQRADGGPEWVDIQRQMFREVRAAAADLTLVVTPACWSKMEGLAPLAMADFDAQTLVDVHYYEPWVFTHQSATWTVPWIRYLAGLSYPPRRTNVAKAKAASARLFTLRKLDSKPTEFQETLRQIDWYARNGSGPDRINADMLQIAAWATAQGLPLERMIIGEFGAIRVPEGLGLADDGSRIAWIETVRKAADAAGFGWAHWSYHDGFGLVVDEATGRMDPSTLRALGLTVE